MLHAGHSKMDFLSLPIVMIENILSYLSYDEIAKNRIVCQDFNVICQRLLNRGFLLIERRHALSLKTVKAQLPRRESERRCHPLARHCDILMSIETRISMLNMTYSKFIENGICCFIPGKVIDEISRVLRIVENSTSPPRAHEVLQELRDISSMAIEHFDDKISPAFKKKLQAAAAPHAQRPRHNIAPMAVDYELLVLKRRTLMNAKLSVYLASQYVKMFSKMGKRKPVYRKQSKKILIKCARQIKLQRLPDLSNGTIRRPQVASYKKTVEKQRQSIRRLVRKQTEQESAIAELKRRVEECDIKYSELTHTNQAVGGKSIVAASAGTEEMPPAAQPLKHFASQIKLDLSVLPIGTSKRPTSGKLLPNIKPRKPVIKLPSLSEDDTSEAPEDTQTTKDKREKKKFVDDSKPSTSKDRSDVGRPKKCQSEQSKLRKITKELRLLSDSDVPALPQIKLGKRPVDLGDLEADTVSNESAPAKKQKTPTIDLTDD